MQEEADRTRAGFNTTRDPANNNSYSMGTDLNMLKAKFPFLRDYSDSFIRDTGVTNLIKAETASRKLQDYDKNKRAEDKLYCNRELLARTTINIEAGVDNRLDVLHAARCLPGATCSAGKMWLHARTMMGNKGHAALSTYDMASIGLGGAVTAKGWVELHDPSSPNMSIKMFSMTNCATKSKKDNEDADFLELADLTDFKTALRVLRGAMSYVHPWNRSIEALENFLIQNNYGAADLSSVDKPATYLSQFTDYVLVENSSRWRGMEMFLNTRDLRATWADFISQRATAINNSKKTYNNKPYIQQTQHNTTPTVGSSRHVPTALFFDDICVMWNLGKCVKPPGTCQTRKGRILRHVCNYRPNPAKPDVACGLSHPCYTFHK